VRAVARTLVAAALLVALGCGGGRAHDPTLLGFEGRDRETLLSVYPPGMPREQVRAREAEALVFSVNACDLGNVDRDRALAKALKAFRTEFPRVTASCDRVRLASTGWATVVGGLAYYQDYVFYDDDDQVLVAYRTYLQRSGD